MVIGIDARFFGPIGKGLGRYTQKLIENLEKNDRENNYVIFLRKENWNEYVPRASNFKKVLAPFLWYTLREQIMMPRVIKQQKIDLMHFPHFNVPVFYRGNFVVTIHDLILLRFPTKKATALGPIRYKIKELGYKLTIRRAIRKAKKIIAVSEFTKNDIVDYFHVEPEKLVVTYEGVDMEVPALSANEKSEVLKKYAIPSPYLLYVGNVYPHKNIEILLVAMKKINEDSFLGKLKLVIVCKPDYFLQKIKEYAVGLDITHKLIFPGYVPDQDLTVIYQSAVAYVFPSLYEGFGLPPLEAMVQGTPVISSNVTSMREVLKDGALYFNPGSVLEIINNLKQVINDNSLKQRLIARGFEITKMYDWDAMAKKTIEVYNTK